MTPIFVYAKIFYSLLASFELNLSTQRKKGLVHHLMQFANVYMPTDCHRGNLLWPENAFHADIDSVFVSYVRHSKFSNHHVFHFTYIFLVFSCISLYFE